MQRTVTRRILPFICLLLACTFFLAACGGSSNGTSAGGTSTATPASSASSPANDSSGPAQTGTGTGKEVGEAVKDSIVYELYANPSLLDPQGSASLAEWHVNMNIFDNLFRAYQQNFYDCRPWLVESYEISEDLTDWTLKLREGVLFHDGSELTADDVVYTLLRAKEKPVSGVASTTFVNITALDTYTVLIEQDVRLSILPEIFAGPQFGIVSKNALETYGEGTQEAIVGTGPYKFVSWDTDNSITVEYFEDFFMAKDPEYGEPQIKTCVFRPIADANAATIAFDSGEIDVFGRNILLSDFERYRADPNVNVHEVDQTSTRGLSMNNETGPFTDVRVRRAMNHAMDKEAINLLVAEGQYVAPIYTKLDYRLEGYSLAEEQGIISKYEYDVDEAKALMMEAGYDESNPLNVSLISSTSTVMVGLSQAMQDYMSKIYTNVEVETMEGAQFNQRVSNGDYECGTVQWALEYYWGPMIVRVWTSYGSYFNYEQYNNPRVMEIIAEAADVFEQDERAPLYAEMIKLVTEDAVIAPIYRVQGMIATNNGLNIYSDDTNLICPVYWMHY